MKRRRGILGLENSISYGTKLSWKSPKGKLGEEDSQKLTNDWILRIVFGSVMLIFLVRLFSLTVVNGAKNRELADTNRIRIVDIEAPRGTVVDRFGKIVAVSQISYYLKKGETEREITKEEAENLTKKGQAAPNAAGEAGEIEVGVKRIYSQGGVLSHVLGYVNGVQKEDLAANPSLSVVDSVGRLGLESTYDNLLRGRDGREIIEVDASGKKISVLGRQEPVIGRNLQLTIDSALQQKVFDALTKAVDKASKKGAVVVSDPNTGQILALVSLPNFDPVDIGRYTSDVNNPFLNRAISGEYPPGSTFKVISALAGLESGKITKDDEIEDVGEFFIGDVRFPNWFYIANGQKEGNLKMEKAIARSNDIYFYRLAERTGLDNLRAIAVKFGFGQTSGVDLPGEGLGLVPSSEWKESTFSTGWYLGDTMHLGIGQGFMLATPIQVNKMTSYMAVSKLTKPYLVTQVGDIMVKPKAFGETLTSQENFNVVRGGMAKACEGGGTGWPFFESKYKVGCKTGTAEKVLGDPHAWFTAFAPYDAPKVAVTVIVEEGGEGSTIAGPVAKEILDWYFENR